jgi:hypothetical protein
MDSDARGALQRGRALEGARGTGLAALASTGAAALLAAAVNTIDVDGLDIPRVILAGAGALLAGIAVVRRPQTDTLLLAALCAVLAWFGCPAAWDSGRILVGAAGGLALFAAALLAMPQTPRRVVLSVVVLFHFGGLVIAVTHPTPAPWLTEQVWTRVYRPYLQFMYLNNAYHFYSPEPGPANLMWACIYYSDGSTHWVKMPRRPYDIKDPLAIEYYRRLSLTEQLNMSVPLALINPADLQEAVRRRAAYLNHIPKHTDSALEAQYRMPIEMIRRDLLPCYSRFLALHHAKEGAEVTGIRLYRVEHQIIAPKQYAHGANPYDPITYMPYYLGKYDKDGNLTDADDPMLYWLVPIIGKPKASAPPDLSRPALEAREFYDTHDFVKQHAGSNHEEGDAP